MPSHQIVSESEWIDARKALLAKKKEFTHLREELNRQRLALPWVKVEKNYVFDTPAGKKTLADLFEGRSQLLIYHFMLAPGWTEGCPGCSFVSDHIDGAMPHINARDVTLVAVSRAPVAQIEAFKTRMGWRFKWASSNTNGFNFDYHVSFTKEQLARGPVEYNFEKKPDSKMEELPGLSAFIKEKNGEIYPHLLDLRAGWRCCWARTISWTWRPRAATRTA